MSQGKFNSKEFQKFSKDNNIKIKSVVINSIKDENVFKSNIIKEIFKIKDKDLQLITNSQLTENYIVLAKNTEKLQFDKKNNDYKKYKNKAKLNLANQIYRNYDLTVNDKYDIKINENVLNRIKNTL